MKYEDIVKDLKKGIFHQVYFLCGDESYYIDRISTYMENNVIEEGLKDFNRTILYGKDVDCSSVVTAAKRFPVMSDRQVVVVKEAQNLRSLDSLDSYIDDTLDSTILVFCYMHKSLDKRTSVYKKINKSNKCVFLESKRLYENQVPDWIYKYCRQRGFLIDEKSCALLLQFIGNDLSRLHNEISKLIINLKSGERISPEHIEKYIGISKDFNVFELNNAIGRKDVLAVNRIVNYFEANQKNNPLLFILSMLFNYFNSLLAFHFAKDKIDKNSLAKTMGVNPFFVKDYVAAAKYYNPKKVVDIIALLRDFDLKSKGVNNAGTSSGELLRELMYKILH